MYSFISIHASGIHHPTSSSAPSYAASIPRLRVRRRRNTVAAGASDRRRLDTTRVLCSAKSSLPIPKAVSPSLKEPWIQGLYASRYSAHGAELRSIDRSRQSSDDGRTVVDTNLWYHENRV